VGLNYVSHIHESGLPTPKFPMLFMKPLSAVIGPGEPIVYPRKGRHVDYEAELVAVIGKRARHVPEERALDYVLGYTCGNDVSERVIQKAEMSTGVMLVGKGFDTFCPLGPVIATGLDPTNLDVMARLNGEQRQKGSTSDLLFSVAHLVAYLSEAMLLLPGDVIMTGTPAGVGPIAAGDVVEIEISGVGVLRNPVVAEA
jgi:2-keto-4-pentenoate hydratase/2-oxohepta-3-ene-1,7-dioic acid hydratase in catechol pathway